MKTPTKRRVERNAGAFLSPSHGVLPAPMRTLSDDYADEPEPEDSDRAPEPEAEPGLVRRLLPRILLVLAGGVALSVVAFWLTSATPSHAYLGGPCTDDVAVPGFDPWTGQPRGFIYDRYADDCLTLPAPWENPTRLLTPFRTTCWDVRPSRCRSASPSASFSRSGLWRSRADGVGWNHQAGGDPGSGPTRDHVRRGVQLRRAAAGRPLPTDR